MGAGFDVPVRDAATVILLRDSPATGRPEVWLLTRTSEMTFAAGMSVFPGGRVDDADGNLPWSGRPAEAFAEDLGCDVTLARALVGAAVRETFEETGVLLSNPSASLAHRQPEVETGRLAFGDLLAEHRLAIDADALRSWARWITPAAEHNARRYDTRFFVAALPAGAEADDLTSESTMGEWLSPAAALAGYDSGSRDLLPPTLVTLRTLAGLDTVADILRAAEAERPIAAVSPVMETDADGLAWAVLPDGTRLRLSLQDGGSHDASRV